jgi:hypothetical protein
MQPVLEQAEVLCCRESLSHSCRQPARDPRLSKQFSGNEAWRPVTEKRRQVETVLVCDGYRRHTVVPGKFQKRVCYNEFNARWKDRPGGPHGEVGIKRSEGRCAL